MSLKDISHTFENGITVVNTTPHPLNFQDSVTNEKVVIPTSVPEGERTGDFVVNAGSNEKPLGGGLVTTEFVKTEDGQNKINEIKDWAKSENLDVRIVGSTIAAQAYPKEVVGMVAAPGFERVPPQDKLMSSDKFTAFEEKSDDTVKEELKEEVLTQIGYDEALLEFGGEIGFSDEKIDELKEDMSNLKEIYENIDSYDDKKIEEIKDSIEKGEIPDVKEGTDKNEDDNISDEKEEMIEKEDEDDTTDDDEDSVVGD